MVEVRRKPGESASSLIRRFGQRVRSTGILLRAKRARFYHRPKSKILKRQEAIRKKIYRERKEYLKKIGILKEE